MQAARSIRWTALTASNAPCPRSSHQLSSWGSRIFLFGGENGPENSHFGYGLPVRETAVHCFDLSCPDAWQVVPVSAGNPPSARLGHGQTIVEGENGPSLYVFGGRQPLGTDLDDIRSLNDLHRFNLNTGAWEEVSCTGDVPSVRSYHQMVAVNQTLYVFAGMVNDNRYSDLYAFDTDWQTQLRSSNHCLSHSVQLP